MYILVNDDCMKIKQATDQGYIEFNPIGGIGIADFSYVTSKTRRGRVQSNGSICPTIATTGDLYVIWEI